MKTYLLFDMYNLFFRAMHTISDGDLELQKGMLLHTMFTMVKKASDTFNPNHLVFCLDGMGTWRKSIYPQYKANRIEKLQERKPADVIRETELKKVFEEDFLPFISEKTNVSVLEYSKAEADDIIACFIELHPNDNTIIVSTDNDFVQLLNDNVIIFNTMDNRIITKDCIITADKHKPLKFIIKNGKVSISRTDPFLKEGESLTPMDNWVEYALFSKCIRGDTSDNITSAYPNVREKSTKNKIGILDAFADRVEKGYNWQSFMHSSWEDALGNKHLVKECYEFNKKLIDLKEIPEDLKTHLKEYIINTLGSKEVTTTVFNIAKYLGKWELNKLLESYNSFAPYFSRKYMK